MKRESRLLLNNALEGLVLSIEAFNRPSGRGRLWAVLSALNHSLEQLLKAAIVDRGGTILDLRSPHTITLEACIGKCLSDAKLKCLGEGQAIVLRTVMGLRGASEHHLLALSESELYTHTQAGVTLFGDVLSVVFGTRLADLIPARVLPVSVEPPTDILALIGHRYEYIKTLLRPGTRRRTEAKSALRALAVMEGAVEGVSVQPSESTLDKFARKVSDGEPWETLFPGVASLSLDTEGSGLTFNVRISKTEGLPIRVVKAEEVGADGVTAVVLKRVNELGYYTLGLIALAERLGATPPRVLELIRFLDLQSDPEYFKEFRVQSARHKLYSQKALQRLRKAMSQVDIDAVWEHARGRGPRPTLSASA